MQPGKPIQFEPLEPRLLLDADLGEVQPLLCESTSTDPAVHVDLDQQDDATQGDLTPVFALDAGAGTEGDQAESTVLASISILAGSVAPDLPGMQLAYPDISGWQGQIIYLDFDGEQNVVYNGPVSIGPFHLPGFQAPGELAGQEPMLMADVLARLQELFAGTGVLFTLERPPEPLSYSTVHIGGNDAAFQEYGSFSGLAENVDAGNVIQSDAGFVFTEVLLGALAAPGDVREVLFRAIAHEVGHLLGYEHDDLADHAGESSVLSTVALLGVTALGNGISIASGDVTPNTTDGTDFGSIAQGGAAISRTFMVRNDGTMTATLGGLRVPDGYTLTEPLVTSLEPGAWDTFTVRLEPAVAGTKLGDISFVINGSEANRFRFRVTGAVTATQTPAEQFIESAGEFDLAYKAILFTPAGTGYTFLTRSITALPTNPEGGTRLTLGDDESVLVSLGSGARVVLYGQSYDKFYVGSNGYITFTPGDTSFSETLEWHFAIPRISALYDDLNPTVGGQVSYQQFSDRVIVTWEQVADYGTGGACTFQATMYFDGRIELAWLAVASRDGIVGLSNGSGLPTDFTEANFSHSTTPAPEVTVVGNEVSIANGDTTPATADHTDFGSAVQGETAIRRTFTIRNDGTSTLLLGAMTVPTGFALIEGLSSSLTPGESDTFTVELDMAKAGTWSGDISFSTNDGNENPFSFRITGTVIAPAEVTVLGNGISVSHGDTSPSSTDHTDFGSAVQGAAPIIRTFTVRNDGDLTLMLGEVTVPTGFTLLEPLAISLEPGESATFTVQLDTAVAGIKSGDIVFANNDSDESPFRFRIAGAVLLAGGPEIAVLGNGVVIFAGNTTPTTLNSTDFWQVDVGRTATRTFTISNLAEATLNLTGSSRVTLSGSSDFSVFVQPDSSVAGGGSTTFQIQFRPSSVGLKTATVSIANDDADENPYTFTIQGTGVVWDFFFYEGFDDDSWTGWNAVDPLTGAPTTAPQVVVSPEGYALAGLGSGYGQESDLYAVLTHALALDGIGELKISMRAKAGPDQPNAVHVQLFNGNEYYTVVNYWMDSWDPDAKAQWYSLVDGVEQQHSSNLGATGGDWHDFTWLRSAQGLWSLYIDGRLIASDFQREGQLTAFTQVAISLLRDQSQVEWISISGNKLPEHPSALPVYRFWSPVTSKHFYTISEGERDKVIHKLSDVWTYEGIAYYAYAADNAPAGTAPVYRFWSGTLNSHFYTTSPGERDKLINNFSDVWTYEGVAFHAYAAGSQPVGTSAVYRFWSNSLGGHFFTQSRGERDKLINQFAQTWTFELISWYAYEA